MIWTNPKDGIPTLWRNVRLKVAVKLTSSVAEERGNRGSCASKKRTRSNGRRPSFSSPRRDYHLGCLLTQPRSNKSAGKFAAERPCKTRGGQIYRRNDDETVDALQNQQACLPVPERGIAITTRTDENRREPTRTDENYVDRWNNEANSCGPMETALVQTQVPSLFQQLAGARVSCERVERWWKTRERVSIRSRCKFLPW